MIAAPGASASWPPSGTGLPAALRAAIPDLTFPEAGHRPGPGADRTLPGLQPWGRRADPGASSVPPAALGRVLGLGRARRPARSAARYILNALRIDGAVAALPSRLEMPSISSIERSIE
jgi:hypothetical protein